MSAEGRKLRRLAGDHYIFRCPGCKTGHMVKVGTDGWTFNGNGDAPTFTPSVFVNYDGSCPGVPRCHSFVTDGQIQFLTDSTHELAGQTVPLPDFPGSDE